MMNKNKEIILKIENVKMDFNVGGQIVPVLKGISLDINQGDFAVIFGPSGCGKSTLLHCILGMEKPTSGKVLIEGTEMGAMIEDDVVRFRKTRIGIVFQQSIWIKSLNVLENVSFPNLLKGMTKEEAQRLALETLKDVKLDNWANYNPSSLSGGQQQRVSLARALTLDPAIIVADEPTGNLDTVAGDELINLLVNLNKEKGKTIVMVTHDLEYLKFANKLFHIIDGELVEQFDNAGAIKMSGSLRTKKGERTQKTVCHKDYLESKGTTCK
ncbi:MAG: ABC transporter ATP-binding protein [Candidatus Shapirobacteria bacterium]|nr:ABC transporter ATP-binding protein [Candidatus Shapirobacteria bacterium]